MACDTCNWEEAAGRNDLSGRTVLVTGGSSGVGEAACAGFASAGAHVYMLARDYDRAVRAIGRIESRLPVSGGTIKLELCDLSDLSEVRRFAESFQARFDRLDLLVNNAGVLPRERTHTPDGVELTFATNVLGPFLLTSLLLPALLAAAPSRVITVSSGGMYTARLRPDDLQLENAALRRRALLRPHQTRAGRPQPSLGREASRPITSPSTRCIPVGSTPPGLRTSLPRFRRVMRPLLRDARQGADTDRLARESSGRSSRRPAASGRTARRDPSTASRSTRETHEDRERLWRECERLCTVSESPRAAAIC